MDETVELVADRWKIHVADKRQPEQYESYEARQTLEGDIPRGVNLNDPEARLDLKARLLAVRKELQETVVRDAENRIRADSHEDWSPNGVGDDDE